MKNNQDKTNGLRSKMKAFFANIRHGLWQRNKRLIKFAKLIKTAKFIGVFLIIFFVFQMAYIVTYGRMVGCPETSDSHDAVVVLGNKVYPNGVPSPILQSRLDEAYKVTQDEYCNRSGYIIVSGGLGKEGVYEGDAMAAYLIGLGMSADKIIIDNAGNNTYLTAINAKRISAEYGFESILVVSSYYHVLRSLQAFRSVGFDQVAGQGSKYLAFKDILGIPRELAGIYVYFFKY